MQYPREEDAEGCMRIDVIEELIKEVQEEDTMLKSQAKQARGLQACSVATKKTQSNHEGSSAERSDEIVGCWCHIPNFGQFMD
ncbi:hypothetical protein PIB30_100951 [Stylosanthes scabra]|uniref:Uncharacterized protein n=1 Tax=Stylosanthes scabra TaxID=79078 RepID=A0ABU6QYS3_9FABA|nr:hypothetical protein [Stylosanthes scabra]